MPQVIRHTLLSLRDLAVTLGPFALLAAAGPAFCAGADLNWMKRMAGYGYEQNLADAGALAEMLKTLDRLSKPTIARVHGAAFAGGVGLVAACDIAIGTLEAKFCLSEAKLGLSPATISPLRPQRSLSAPLNSWLSPHTPG